VAARDSASDHSDHLVARRPARLIPLASARRRRLCIRFVRPRIKSGAGACAAAIVCSGNVCWHTHERYVYPPDAGVIVHPDDWRWGPSEHFTFREPGPRGNRRGVLGLRRAPARVTIVGNYAFPAALRHEHAGEPQWETS
jgi:hypothetical protein